MQERLSVHRKRITQLNLTFRARVFKQLSFERSVANLAFISISSRRAELLKIYSPDFQMLCTHRQPEIFLMCSFFLLNTKMSRKETTAFLIIRGKKPSIANFFSLILATGFTSIFWTQYLYSSKKSAFKPPISSKK